MIRDPLSACRELIEKDPLLPKGYFSLSEMVFADVSWTTEANFCVRIKK